MVYNLWYSVAINRWPLPNPISSATFEIMWWKCDVQFCRTRLRLKLWARNEGEARSKVERMYQVATIQNLTLSGDGGFPAFARKQPESVVN